MASGRKLEKRALSRVGSSFNEIPDSAGFVTLKTSDFNRKDFITTKEAAKLIKYSYTALYIFMGKGELGHKYRFGDNKKKIFLRRENVLNFKKRSGSQDKALQMDLVDDSAKENQSLRSPKKGVTHLDASKFNKEEHIDLYQAADILDYSYPVIHALANNMKLGPRFSFGSNYKQTFLKKSEVLKYKENDINFENRHSKRARDKKNEQAKKRRSESIGESIIRGIKEGSGQAILSVSINAETYKKYKAICDLKGIEVENSGSFLQELLDKGIGDIMSVLVGKK